MGVSYGPTPILTVKGRNGTVTFDGATVLIARTSREHLGSYASGRGRVGSPDHNGVTVPDPVDQLRRLAELWAAGVVSEQGFEQMKTRLLG